MFCYEIIISKPDIFPILKGLVPQKEVITNPSMLYIAIGILGATVMPHNFIYTVALYKPEITPEQTKEKRSH
jgi:manganese transport protein